jgi:hypothetical protein
MNAPAYTTALTIKRIGKNTYIVPPYTKETLTRKQLTRLLIKRIGLAPEELALAYVEFHLDPDKTEAHFGMQGSFLYAK